MTESLIVQTDEKFVSIMQELGIIVEQEHAGPIALITLSVDQIEFDVEITPSMVLHNPWAFWDFEDFLILAKKYGAELAWNHSVPTAKMSTHDGFNYLLFLPLPAGFGEQGLLLLVHTNNRISEVQVASFDPNQRCKLLTHTDANNRYPPIVQVHVFPPRTFYPQGANLGALIVLETSKQIHRDNLKAYIDPLIREICSGLCALYPLCRPKLGRQPNPKDALRGLKKVKRDGGETFFPTLTVSISPNSPALKKDEH